MEHHEVMGKFKRLIHRIDHLLCEVFVHEVMHVRYLYDICFLLSTLFYLNISRLTILFALVLGIIICSIKKLIII